MLIYMKSSHQRPLPLLLVVATVMGCGPRVGNGDAGGSSSISSDAEEESAATTFDTSWAIGAFTMRQHNVEPVVLFMGLEIPEEGHAVATRYDCDWDGGPAEPNRVTQLEWRAVSETVIEVIPPVPGEEFYYSSERVPDLFIERPSSGDGIIVYSSQTNDQWPHYGNFVRGRPCGYFQDGMSCLENFYYRVCPE